MNFQMDLDDFYRIVEIVRPAMADNINNKNFEEIIAKYSFKNQVGQIKRKLYDEMKKYPQKSYENEEAYKDYKRADDYFKHKQQQVDNGKWNYCQATAEVEIIFKIKRI